MSDTNPNSKSSMILNAIARAQSKTMDSADKATDDIKSNLVECPNCGHPVATLHDASDEDTQE